MVERQEITGSRKLGTRIRLRAKFGSEPILFLFLKEFFF